MADRPATTSRRAVLTTGPDDEPTELSDLRASVAGLLSSILPTARALELDAAGEFDPTIWRALGAAGLLGVGTPERAGGSGGTVTDAAAVTEEIARVLPSLAVDYVLSGMAGRMLADSLAGPLHASMPGLMAGTFICSFALSEPSAGTDLLSLRTTARPVDDGFVLNGQKTWISLAGHADVILLLAKTEPVVDGRPARSLSLLAVPADAPGVTIRRIHLAGMRAATSYEIFLDDVTVPADAVVGERGRGMTLLSRTLDVERVLAAAISIGIGRAALDLHVAHAGQRIAFGRPIGALQAVQHPAADSMTELFAARSLMDRAAHAVELSTGTSSSLTAMAKLNAVETTARIVDRAMRAAGAMGLAAESPLQMYFRDARLQLFSPVSNEMIRNILGEAMGLPRSY